MEFEAVIGLEVHVQLSTKSKVFCGCATEFGAKPNSQTCPVCLGLPGSLPVLNRTALECSTKVALALGCKVHNLVKFDRKNYFYPDLPKNYQISQFGLPLANDGFVVIDTESDQKRIRVRRVHLEEDAGKLIHPEGQVVSLVDYNRTGQPLLEIVSEPDINSPDEAYDYLTKLKLILRYLGVSDCDMEKGSLRCDANISIRPKGEKNLGTKSELKNMNSFKAVRAGLAFEIERQMDLTKRGEPVIQETRLWDDKRGITIVMRSKEEAHDYRYFPEPDLVPFEISQKEIDAIKASIPELPAQKLERFMTKHSLPRYDANILIQNVALADYFERCLGLYPNAKNLSNWLMGPVLSDLNARKTSIDALSLKPETLIELIVAVDKGIVSNLVGKDVLKEMIAEGKSAAQIIKEKNLAQVSDASVLVGIIEEIIKENAGSVADYKNGKEGVLQFLVGQVMKKSNGKANPKVAAEMLKERIRNV